MKSLSQKYLESLGSVRDIKTLNTAVEAINLRHPVGSTVTIVAETGGLVRRSITRGLLGFPVPDTNPPSFAWTFEVSKIGTVPLDRIVAFESEEEDESDAFEKDHADLVARLAKPGGDIIANLTPESAHLWHMGTGVAGEGGELLDATKKYAVYGRPLDRENVIEELGDLEFYMRGVREAIGVTRSEVLAYNISKLNKRYPAGTYTNEHANKRLDKTEPVQAGA